MAITNHRHLLKILGIKSDELNEIFANLPNYYKPFIKEEKKKDGTIKKRPICPSVGKLLLIQHRVKNRVLKKHPLPDYIYGGVKGKDSIKNGKAHKGKNFHFCLDLKNFFPSVKSNRVNRVLLKLGYSPKVSNILTKLVTATINSKTVILNREVPQGTPTSSLVTNLAFYIEVDIYIEKIIQNKGITYTRYADDLNFSSQKDFLDSVTEIVQSVSKANFKINRKKTFYKRGKVEITGNDIYQNSMKPPVRLFHKLNEPDRTEKSKAGLLNHINRIIKA